MSADANCYAVPPKETGRGSLRARLFAVAALSSIISLLSTAALMASYFGVTAKRQAQRDLARQADVLAAEAARVLASDRLSGGRLNLSPSRRLPLRALLGAGRLDYVGLWASQRNGLPVEVVSAGSLPPSREDVEAAFAHFEGRSAEGPAASPVPPSDTDGEDAGRPDSFVFEYRSADRERLWAAAQVVPLSDQRLVVVVARRGVLFGEGVVARIVIAGIAGLAVALVLAAWLSHRIVRPLEEIERTARSIALGDYTVRVPPQKDKELSRVAEAMNNMADAVEAARRREQQLLMTISHDLRTPLAAIQAYAEAVADGTLSGSTDTKKAAGVIASEARRLARLVDVIFDSARLGSGSFELREVEIDLADFVDDVASVFQARAEQKKVALETEMDAGCRLRTDADLLARALSNLLDNALKATEAGGRIRIEGRCVDSSVEISVSDTGSGIPEDLLPRIFEPGFSASRNTEGGPGLGLGLSITKQIVEALGGRIRVASSPGAGTTFTITLTREPAANTRAAREQG